MISLERHSPVYHLAKKFRRETERERDREREREREREKEKERDHQPTSSMTYTVKNDASPSFSHT
jgi:hypothetical protein